MRSLARDQVAVGEWVEHPFADRVEGAGLSGADLPRANRSDLLAGGVWQLRPLGAGTADGHVVPAARRAAVSKQSGWIAPVVVAGGSVRGTWELDGDEVRVAWFAEAGRRPRKALEAEVARLSSILSRDLRLAISAA